MTDVQRSLVLVKPDGVRRGLSGEILRRIEAKGYTLAAVELRTATPEILAEHYAEHEGKPFYGPLVEFMLSGPVLAVVCLLLAGMLRAEWAYVVSYVVQVAAIALGFVVPVMFGLGAIFAALWAGADLLGRKIERERAAAWAAYRSEQG